MNHYHAMLESFDNSRRQHISIRTHDPKIYFSQTVQILRPFFLSYFLIRSIGYGRTPDEVRFSTVDLYLVDNFCLMLGTLCDNLQVGIILMENAQRRQGDPT